MWISAAVSLSLNENSANEVTKTHRTTEETPVHTSDVNSCVFHVSSANEGCCKCNVLQKPLEKCFSVSLPVCQSAHDLRMSPYLTAFPVVILVSLSTFLSVTALK